MPLSIERRDAIAIVRLDNPPVNAIGQAERNDLLAAAAELSADPTVKAVVLTGAGKIFAAGADAREFDGPALPPHLPQVVAAIMESEKPWIAAIKGPALGGGLELALACDKRIAAPEALLGLPEVTLGVVPGAGGTQFLPRLVGFAEAVSMIAQGTLVKAAQALSIGLVDEIVDDPLQRALTVAVQIQKRPLSKAKIPQEAAAAAAAARASAARKMRGQTAPLRAIELVERACRGNLAAGLKAERETFLALRGSSQARALRHVFFAERAAKNPPASIGGKARDVAHVTVVGGGTMGTGIAYALMQAKLSVTLVEMDEAGVARAQAGIGRLIEGALSRGLMTEDGAIKLKSRIAFQAGYDSLEAADLVIEAAFESMDVKKEIFAKLDVAAPEALLATNTSYLDINQIAAVTSRPQDVLGLHFFSPAHIMKLLEVVRTGETSDDAIQTAFALAARLKKLPVLAGVCDGFIGNRILARYREIADMILLDGGTPWAIDEAMVEFGYTMGPYEAQDQAGLDIAYANRKRLAATRDPARRYVTIADRMVEEGRIGKKVGVGWYRYPGGGGAVEDPLVEDLIAEEAHFAKVKRRPFTADEIRTRLLAAMVNEAAGLLHEGIAHSAVDIDLVTINGYGFPRWRGGLMHYGAEYGFANVIADIQGFARENPIVWRVSEGLQALAARGRTSAA